MIDGKNFFHQPIKSDMRAYDNVQKIATGQGSDYTTGCLLDCNYFNKHCKVIAIGLRKQEALDVDPKAIEQINFTGNLELKEPIFLIIEEAKETILDFSQGIVKVF